MAKAAAENAALNASIPLMNVANFSSSSCKVNHEQALRKKRDTDVKQELPAVADAITLESSGQDLDELTTTSESAEK